MKHASCPSSPPTASGFTLLELLGAVAILAILSTLLFTAFNQASKAWQMAEKRVETADQVRAAFDLFTRELSQAIIHTNRPRQLLLQGRRDWIAFLAAPVDTRTNHPDVLITYQAVTSSNGLFSLCRTIDANGFQGTVPRLTADPVNDVILENVVSMVFSNLDRGNWASGAAPVSRNPVAVSLSVSVIDSRAAAQLARGGDRNKILLSETENFHIKVYLPNR